MSNNNIGQTNGGSNNEYNVDFNLNGEDTKPQTSSRTGSYNYVGDVKIDERGQVREANEWYSLELSDNPEQDQEIIIGISPLIIPLSEYNRVKNAPRQDVEKD